jgi:hypothetical protein
MICVHHTRIVAGRSNWKVQISSFVCLLYFVSFRLEGIKSKLKLRDRCHSVIVFLIHQPNQNQNPNHVHLRFRSNLIHSTDRQTDTLTHTSTHTHTNSHTHTPTNIHTHNRPITISNDLAHLNETIDNTVWKKWEFQI